MEKKFHIVWNETKTEGFITDDADDARFASTGEMSGGFGVSTIGEAFQDCYGGGDKALTVQEVEIAV